MAFTGTTTVSYTEGYVNDTCPADGLGVWSRAIAKAGTQTIYGSTWHKDTGGCEGIPAERWSGTLSSSGGKITAAGLQVCLYDNNNRVDCKTSTMITR